MATNNKGRASNQYRSALHPLRSRRVDISVKDVDQIEKELHQSKKSKIALEKKDWEDATCSVCMEYPHNAVLLLCSSHDKGCRPYMCATSYRYSNCLEQFKKAYTKVVSPPPMHSYGSTNNSSITAGILSSDDKFKVMELACPLCRGKVKGMTVVEPAREYLNAKRRSCTQEDCSFMGTYAELRKHVKQDHPYTRPKVVDPKLKEKWSRLESQREHDDVMSTIRTSMPGALIVGDYVIDTGDNIDGEATEDSDVDGVLDIFSFFQEYTRPSNASLHTRLTRLRRLTSFQRRFRLLGDSFGVPATTPAGSAGITFVASSEEENDEPLTDHRHRWSSERRRRNNSSAGILLAASSEEDESLIGLGDRWISDRRRSSSSSAGTTLAASSEENNNEASVGRRHRWRSERRRTSRSQ